MSLTRTPIELSELSAKLQKPLSPQAPKPLRMMAARGSIPLPPPALVTALYQLSLDDDTEVSATAMASVSALAEHVQQAVVADSSLDPRVLDLLALDGGFSAPQLGRLILNKSLDDATMEAVARTAEEAVTEIIAGIHTRLLRTPAIITALYNNPNARQSTLDKIVDLAKREGVEVPGLDAVLSVEIDPDEPTLDEAEFSALLKESHAKAETEASLESNNSLTRQLEEEEDEEVSEHRLARYAQIQRMGTAQKVRLAGLGNREDRSILIQERKRVVYMAVIKSPRVSISEVAKYAKNKNLPDDLIAYIAQKRDWIRYYAIVLMLVKNPKCPLADGLRFLNQVRANDLQRLQRDKNVSTQIARQARLLHRQKTSGRRG